MKVRRIRPEDIDDVLQMMIDLYNERGQKHIPMVPSLVRGDITRIAVERPDRDAIFVCENSAGELIGFIKCFISQYFYNYHVRANHQLLYVKPKLRGSRAAYSLMRAYALWGVEHKAICIGLSVSGDEAQQIKSFDKLAKHLGFVEEGRYYRKDVMHVQR